MKEQAILKKFDYKIMHAISYLNEMHIFPNSLGVYKILKGINDFETFNYIDCLSFSSCVSIGSKKVSSRITYLIRINVIQYVYNKSDNELYLKLSNNGMMLLEQYFKKHKNPFKKTIKEEKSNFAKLE